MKKTLEKIAMILVMFGFYNTEISDFEKENTFVFRNKDVSSPVIARNYILAISRMLGEGYHFGVSYCGPRGIISKYGTRPSFFTKNPDKKTWSTTWALTMYKGDTCIGEFVFNIK